MQQTKSFTDEFSTCVDVIKTDCSISLLGGNSFTNSVYRSLKLKAANIKYADSIRSKNIKAIATDIAPELQIIIHVTISYLFR